MADRNVTPFPRVALSRPPEPFGQAGEASPNPVSPTAENGLSLMMNALIAKHGPETAYNLLVEVAGRVRKKIVERSSSRGAGSF